MSRSPKIKKITICGFGLIGGSIALDLLKGKHSYEVHAYDRPAVLAKLKRDRRFNVKVNNSLSEAVDGADIIILAATHTGIRSLLTKISKLKDMTNTLIIDTGAVKCPTAATASKLKFSEGTQFLGTHPMAGRERKGFKSADAGLFKDFAWYLDSDVKLTRINKLRIDWLLKKCGGIPVMIPNEMHDELVSEISHLPQLLSSILGAQIDPKWISLAGPGLRSMLRLSGSPYSVWSEIIEENRSEIIKALDTYADNIKTVKKMVKNRESLEEIFKTAARSYKCSL